jgi:uncharacterized membrane protein
MDFTGMHPLLFMLIFSMLPFFEARYAIPIGILAYGMNPYESFAYGIIVSVFGIFLLILALNKIVPGIKWKWFVKIKEWLFAYTRRKHSKVFEKAATLSVIIFIAIPLPGTGIYAGTLVCYLLGFSFWRTVFAANMGLIATTLIMFISTMGIDATIKMFF